MEEGLRHYLAKRVKRLLEQVIGLSSTLFAKPLGLFYSFLKQYEVKKSFI